MHKCSCKVVMATACQLSELIVVNEEQCPSTTTNCILFWRKDSTHARKLQLPLIP